MLIRPLPATDEEARARLGELIEGAGDSYAAVSIMLGRSGSYLRNHVRLGVPKRLTDGERGDLARYFRVPGWQLGVPFED